MDLIERYVNEVSRRLPRGKRQEVRRELRSAVLDEAEGSEGGMPSEDRVIAVLRKLGPPEQIAASYQPDSQYLIGPALYPLFKKVLLIATTVLISLLVMAVALNALIRPAADFVLSRLVFDLLGGLFDSVWVVFAVIVAIFAGLQRLDVEPTRGVKAWDPRTLPKVREVDLVGRGEAAVHIVAGAVFLTFLQVFRDRIGIVSMPGEEPLHNSILRQYLPWISAALVLGLVLRAYLFWLGRWRAATRLASVAIDLFGLGVLYQVVRAVAAEMPALRAAGLPAPLPMIIGQLAWTILVVVAVFTAFDVGRHLVRLAR